MVEPQSQSLRRQLETHGVIVSCKDGNDYLVRTVRPSDADAIMRGYDALTDEQKWLRVLHTLPHLTPAMAHEFAEPPPDKVFAVVVEGRDNLAGELVGSARIAGFGPRRAAEFSVTVRPEVAGIGLARQALQLVIEVARESGCRCVWGSISGLNGPMIGLAKRMGMTLRRDPEDLAVLIAELPLG